MRSSLRLAIVVFTATAVLAGGAFVTARAVGRDDESGTPAHTVRDFLTTAVVDRAGVYACRYLTPHAMREAQATQAPNVTCPAAMWSTRLVLGGRAVTTEAAVKSLSYSTREDGDRATVTVSADGGSLTFTLRKATGSERVGYVLPHTSWRIDSGVAQLMG